MSKEKTEAPSVKPVEENTVIHFSDIWKGIVKFWWVAVILGILVSLLMSVTSYSKFRPVYEANATFTVNTETMSLTGEGLPSYAYIYDNATASNLADTFPYILSSDILTEAIRDDLNISYLPASLSASAVSSTNMFILTARGSDPQKTYDVLVSAMKNYPNAAKYIVGNVRLTVIIEPQIPVEPINKFTYKVAFKGFGIGVLLGAAWIFVYALFRKTVKTKKDISGKLKLETIGTIPEVDTYNGEKVYQVLGFIPEQEKNLLKKTLDECDITSWNDTGIDIIAKGGGKDVGMQRYMDKEGLLKAETMAFGDGENDIPMLQFAGIGVALGNAKDKVKERADYVTTDIDDNGIENALKHFGLIEGNTDLQTERFEDDRSVTLQLFGPVNTATAEILKNACDAIEDDGREVTIDLDDVDYISSTGLRILLSLSKRIGSDKLHLINVSGDVEQIFEMTGFVDIMDIHQRQPNDPDDYQETR